MLLLKAYEMLVAENKFNSHYLYRKPNASNTSKVDDSYTINVSSSQDVESGLKTLTGDYFKLAMGDLKSDSWELMPKFEGGVSEPERVKELEHEVKVLKHKLSTFKGLLDGLD